MEPTDIYETLAQTVFGKGWLSWYGLPRHITREMLTKTEGFIVHGMGCDRLGNGEFTYLLLQWPHAENIARVWLDEEIVEAVDASVNHSHTIITDIINRLGEPDKQLDYYFNVLKITGGERVYANRGLTLYTDQEGERVRHVLVYPVTNFYTYVNRYRLHLPPMQRNPPRT